MQGYVLHSNDSTIDVTEESSTDTTTEITDFFTSSSPTMADASTTELHEFTSPPKGTTGRPSALPGQAVYTVVTTVEVEGAMEDPSLRENVFDALENDLLIPALAKVRGYIEVRF